MNINIIRKHTANINKLVARKRIKESLELLGKLISESGMGDLYSELEKLESTYENMLKYTLEGIKDPERQKVYNRLLVSILQINDQVKEILLSKNSGWQLYALKSDLKTKQKLSGKTVAENLNDLSFNKELKKVIQENFTLSSDPTSENAKEFEILVTDIYNHFWLTDKYSDGDSELAEMLRKNRNFRWHDKSLFVSAITLSLLRYFDIRKFHILFDFYVDNTREVKQRALIGLVFTLFKYDQRLYLFPEITGRLKMLKDKKGIQKEIEAIIIQIIRSKETEKISKKLRDEIIPEMVKLQPKLEDKLDLKNLVPEDLMDDKNPAWKTVFEESDDLFGKVEEFTKLQTEGADVFMTAFASLKNFDFFRKTMNWFMPFYPDNQVIDESLMLEENSFDKVAFIDGLYHTGFLCNSDKYSFLINVKRMPGMQKKIMLELFNAEMKGMNELSESDELIDQFSRDKVIYTQYLQDLYRFFKLYHNKAEFEDVFSGDLELYNSLFFNILVDDITILRNIAEYYFEKDYFRAALEIYNKLHKQGIKSFEIIEKIAYSYQRLRKWDIALEYYKQAELFEKNRLWVMKKMGLCYRKLGDNQKALEYYKEAEKINSEDLYIQALIGRCYLDLKDFETALKYYFKVEYLDSSKKSVLRPIAWCYFMTNKLKESKKYYTKLFKYEANKYDYMNFGHVEWCLGKKKEAIELYVKSIQEKDNNLKLFMEAFHDDEQILIQKGIDPDEIPIMLDYLQYQMKG
ncbi:MAG: tetratricopeptide repeat protein [Bacteroidetes bacterium]|nr:tetratricopeptide repeat protein [Bacteroidota bacterium]